MPDLTPDTDLNFTFKGKNWSAMEWCVVMGFDAFRLSMGQPTRTFSRAEILAWLASMSLE